MFIDKPEYCYIETFIRDASLVSTVGYSPIHTPEKITWSN